ncbi:uracil-DNA glycosylase-like protein [Coprinopsis sp. MPI-PUGE-AT-0042]|nr:uracil-DNA glycosylase-like protein [Coprinopsis sp. MPI-PUGE-AT-0042]
MSPWQSPEATLKEERDNVTDPLSSAFARKGSLKRPRHHHDKVEADDLPQGGSRGLLSRSSAKGGFLSPSPKKRKAKRAYADPSVYGHLRPVEDYLKVGLDIMFCGINPGQVSATKGHHFANPTNHFWPCLFGGGIIPTRMKADEDSELPEKCNIGITNLVGRPTAEAAELSKAEMKACVPQFLSKVDEYKPLIMCFVGVSIADTFMSQVLKSTGKPKAKEKKPKAAPGLLPFKVIHSGRLFDSLSYMSETLFYCVSSTSGRVVTYKKSDKVIQFKGLSDLRTAIKTRTFDSSDLSVVSGDVVEGKE